MSFPLFFIFADLITLVLITLISSLCVSFPWTDGAAGKRHSVWRVGYALIP